MSEPLASDAWRKTPAKKDTRHWCKGKVGREHELAVRMERWPYRPAACGYRKDVSRWAIHSDGNQWLCFHERYCSVCGKIVGRPERCPDRPAA